jgi:hypothetical protein
MGGGRRDSGLGKMSRCSPIRSKVMPAGAEVSDRPRAPASAPTAPGRLLPTRGDRGNLVPKPNYRQAKKQKELSRKARQLEKQQRRSARPNDSAESPAPLQDAPAGPGGPPLGSET